MIRKSAGLITLKLFAVKREARRGGTYRGLRFKINKRDNTKKMGVCFYQTA